MAGSAASRLTRSRSAPVGSGCSRSSTPAANLIPGRNAAQRPSSPMARPHQPSLLQLLHGLSALLVPLAWLTGLLTDSRQDGR